MMQTMLLFETPPPTINSDGDAVYRPAPLLPPEKPTMNIPPALMFMIDATQRREFSGQASQRALLAL